MAKISLGAPRKSGVTLFASEARTASPTPVNFTVDDADSLEIVVDVTAVALTPSVVFNIERRDTASQTWITLLSSVAVATVQTLRLRVSPHLAAAANTVANDLVGGVMRVRPVHGDADSITYSVGASAL